MEAITISAGERVRISCGNCLTDCDIIHEPSASQNCPQDVPSKEIRHCPYCGSDEISDY